MAKLFTCPRCKKENKLPDDCKKGDEHKCQFCGQKVRLRDHLGYRIPVSEE